MYLSTYNRRKEMKLKAEWENGVKREFDNVDELNVIIIEAELKMWCEEHHYRIPKFTVTK